MRYLDLNTEDFVIFSCFQGNSLAEDCEATGNADIFLMLLDIPYNKCVGVYKGKQETSFAVPLSHVWVAKDYCELYNQECYLEVVKGVSSMVFDESKETLGNWTEIEEPSGDYTFDKLANKYYTIK